MELKSGSISRSVLVGKFVGVGFLNVVTSRGEVKMYSGDHLVEVEYDRPARLGEPGFMPDAPVEGEVIRDLEGNRVVRDPRFGLVKQARTIKRVQFVVPEDAARALGIFLEETVEEEKVRLMAEQPVRDEALKRAEKAVHDEEARATAPNKRTDAQIQAAIKGRVEQEASSIVDARLRPSVMGAVVPQQPHPAVGPLSDRIETNEAFNRRVSGAPLGSVGQPGPTPPAPPTTSGIVPASGHIGGAPIESDAQRQTRVAREKAENEKAAAEKKRLEDLTKEAAAKK